MSIEGTRHELHKVNTYLQRAASREEDFLEKAANEREHIAGLTARKVRLEQALHDAREDAS